MKPKYRYDIEQNTDEWFAEKVKRIGASNANELLMAKTTKGYQDLVDRLIEEHTTGEKTESKTFQGNYYTERGHEFEPIAREDYELRTLTAVKLIGIIILDDFISCSPDGLIGDNGLHQIKCPIFKTQRKYLKIVKANEGLTHNDLLQKIDKGYYKQCQYELYVSGREYNVWTSYHPYLDPIDLTLTRDDTLISEIKQRIEEIKEEVLTEVKSIKK